MSSHTGELSALSHAMDSFNLREHRSGEYQPSQRSTDDEAYRFPRQPSADNSHRSDTSGEESPGSTQQRGIPTHRYIFPPIASDGRGAREPSLERGSGWQSTTHSLPPYHADNGQRHSLPPLRVVLGGDHLSSTPYAPQVADTSTLPSPCEPSFYQEAYKPMSLYPEPIHQLQPGFESPESTSPSSAQSSPDSRLRNSPRVQIDANASNHAHSLSGPSAPFGVVPNDGRTTHEPLSYPRSSFSHATYLPDSNRYYTPVSRGSTGAEHPSYPSMAFDGQRQSPTYWNTHTHPGNATINNSNPAWGGPCLPSSLSSGRRTVLPPSFVTNNLGYHSSKPRKRSNLPKPAVDLMSHWFDQNLSNPYPSEDQKAYMASIGKVTMTQVSNWFINKRRRCPELRHRREQTNRREAKL